VWLAEVVTPEDRLFNTYMAGRVGGLIGQAVVKKAGVRAVGILANSNRGFGPVGINRASSFVGIVTGVAVYSVAQSCWKGES
jgi:hypothetical protein